ncbi:MAG: pectate lyase [Sedimentisphaerales bacterium]|nr:pectate lyase [Sedimentisphaerales bacterium]
MRRTRRCLLTVTCLGLALVQPISARYSNRPTEWYGSAEATRIADNILTWQSDQGSWPKNTRTMSRPYSGDRARLSGTFDNGATTGERRFLARAFVATQDARYRQAFLKGFDHILEAQYPSGGWPQYYPPSRQYHRHITFNDGTMVRLMEFLRDVAGMDEYEFVDAPRRAAAQAAFEGGIQCILKCQIVVDGKPTAWCAQHDEVTYEPRSGRTYELVSLSGAESAGILRLLMQLDNPSPEVVRAIEAAAAWFEAVKLTGIRVRRVNRDRVVVEDPNAPPLWARFYEIGTNQPIFCGRDGVKKYAMSEIEAERRNGYAWYGGWGQEVAADYAEWRQRVRSARAGLVPVELRCEYASDPLGVDVPDPRLFWKVETTARDQRQTAYQILVASSAETLAEGRGDLWDSGKVTSDETIHIRYDGQALKSSQQAFWKVRVWDKDSQVSPWSEAASWTMGLVDSDDWQARWIGAASQSQTLLLRREFIVKPGLTRAVAHVCGLGHYEMSLNGSKVGDDLLAPGWTKYDRTCLYDTHDLTALLREGNNALGLTLGNGMYNVVGGRYVKFKGSFGPLKAICQIRLEYADGTVEVFGTDTSWCTAPGPVTFSCVFGGEDYDARLEPQGWNEPGFDDSGWAPAVVVGRASSHDRRARTLVPSAGSGQALRGHSCAAPPIRAFDVLTPVSVTQLRTGVLVYDLGQNAALMPRVRVSGPAGSVVRIIPAELLNRDGSVDRRSVSGNRPGWWQYTLAGRESETWFPQFFYQGCRYLQVECTPAADGGERPTVQALEGVVVHSISPPVGEFVCSNELFNRIRTLVRWAQRSNMMSVMTDCPHREKLGWLEQYHLNGPSLRYEFDLAQVFTKGANDMADCQLDNGLIPATAPEYVVFDGDFRDAPAWGSAYLLMPWQQYLWTADQDLLRDHYEGMKRYVAYLGSKATDHIVSHGLGDWYDLGPSPPGFVQLTPVPLTATAFYYRDACVLAKIAALLDKPDDATTYERLATKIRTAFNLKFFNAETRQYATGSQCANSIPLVMGLVEPANRQAVLDAVVGDVRQRGNALTAGDVGYRYLLRALAEGGRSDVIFAMNNQSDKPGYGYQLEHGATSLTEAWNARSSSSQNHFMLGQIIEWFYRDLAGIACDPNGPGFKRTIIRPQPVGDLSWVTAFYDSIRGRIGSEWRREDGRFTLEVTIPANTSATVYVPCMPGASVTESDRPAERSEGVRFRGRAGDRMVYEIGSGVYTFQSQVEDTSAVALGR